MWSRTQHLVLSATIFIFAFALRRYFFCGFILGDDVEEFLLARHVLTEGPNFQGHMHLRFGVWFPNYLSFKLLGISETTFFLPTWIVSSTFGVAAYFLLLKWGYRTWEPFLGGLFVASAPFEVLMGTVHANDLWLTAALVVGLLVLAFLAHKPVLQGALLAFCFWYGFYAKLWAVYFLPALAVYYAHHLVRQRAWRSPLSFLVTSVLLHGATSLYWKLKVGLFLPFLTTHSISYPVSKEELGRVFLQYPTMIFQGSEFGTTLFGAVPYLLLTLLLLKALLWLISDRQTGSIRWDVIDQGLLLLYGSFFLLLNFFPNSFTFDQYYSLARIFRYLEPLSFLMTLHLAKLLYDIARLDLVPPKIRHAPAAGAIVLFALLIGLSLVQADEATKPGQIYRQAFLAALDDVRKEAPPKLVVEDWLGFWLREMYLNGEAGRISVPPIYHIYAAKDYEAWLERKQTTLPPGSMLLTGLANYTHYGAHFGGFRLSLFSRPLHPNWTLVKDYGLLAYLPKPEPARLWRLSAHIPKTGPRDSATPTVQAEPESPADYESLFARGMAAFENGDYEEARRHFKKIIQDSPSQADDTFHFYAASFFREAEWTRAIAAFEKLIRTYPQSHWIAGAHWHIGVALRRQGDYEGAQRRFEHVIESFPQDTYVVALARAEIKSLPGTTRGVLVELFDAIRKMTTAD